MQCRVLAQQANVPQHTQALGASLCTSGLITHGTNPGTSGSAAPTRARYRHCKTASDEHNRSAAPNGAATHGAPTACARTLQAALSEGHSSGAIAVHHPESGGATDIARAQY